MQQLHHVEGGEGCCNVVGGEGLSVEEGGGDGDGNWTQGGAQLQQRLQAIAGGMAVELQQVGGEGLQSCGNSSGGMSVSQSISRAGRQAGRAAATVAVACP
jgi:hypothetical protein